VSKKGQHIIDKAQRMMTMINCECMIIAIVTYNIPFEMYKHLKVILVMMILKGHGSSCSYHESPSFSMSFRPRVHPVPVPCPALFPRLLRNELVMKSSGEHGWFRTSLGVISRGWRK